MYINHSRIKTYSLPTGVLFVDYYSKGQLETLSIGDYGKYWNVKSDFLGYTREIHGVPNRSPMPLSEKWVITLSTQYGCPMKCTFCDVPNIQFKGNVSFEDLKKQFFSAIRQFPEVTYTERLNIHFARMGEPIFNEDVLVFSTWLAGCKEELIYKTGLRVEVIHPVLTTSMPVKFKRTKDRLLNWCSIKNGMFNGQAGLQLSINSTSDYQRGEMFSGMQMMLKDIGKIGEVLPVPLGRKYCLNFAYASDFEIDGKKLASLFDSEKFMCKITPIHNNEACKKHKLETIGGYDSYLPYKKPEEELKKWGFDVLVFVPSMDEERGIITCGNALLGGSNLCI